MQQTMAHNLFLLLKTDAEPKILQARQSRAPEGRGCRGQEPAAHRSCSSAAAIPSGEEQMSHPTSSACSDIDSVLGKLIPPEHCPSSSWQQCCPALDTPGLLCPLWLPGLSHCLLQPQGWPCQLGPAHPTGLRGGDLPTLMVP